MPRRTFRAGSASRPQHKINTAIERRHNRMTELVQKRIPFRPAVQTAQRSCRRQCCSFDHFGGRARWDAEVLE
eukprot:4381885-Prymnesium_polylepis.1